MLSKLVMVDVLSNVEAASRYTFVEDVRRRSALRGGQNVSLFSWTSATLGSL